MTSYDTTHPSVSGKEVSLFRKNNAVSESNTVLENNTAPGISTISESNTASGNSGAVLDLEIADSLLATSTGPVPYRLTNDYMFRAVMQKSDNALRHLLAALLDIPFDSITSCQILNPIILGEAIDEKSSIMDIRLLLNNTEMINLELQAGHFEYWAARALFYLSRLYCNIKRGEEYSRIKSSLHIGILTESPFDEVHEFYSEYFMMNPVNDHIFSRKFSVRMLDLSMINEVAEEQRGTELYNWARFFTATTWEEIKMLSKENECVTSAASYLRILTEDEKIQEQCAARERYYMDMSSSRVSGVNAGIKIGTEQGIKIGTEQGRLKNLISQCCKKIKRGKSVEEIADDLETDISEIIRIVEAAERCAPDYDEERIFELLDER